MLQNPQRTEEILNGKLQFLCRVCVYEMIKKKHGKKNIQRDSHKAVKSFS